MPVRLFLSLFLLGVLLVGCTSDEPATPGEVSGNPESDADAPVSEPVDGAGTPGEERLEDAGSETPDLADSALAPDTEDGDTLDGATPVDGSPTEGDVEEADTGTPESDGVTPEEEDTDGTEPLDGSSPTNRKMWIGRPSTS